MKWPKLAKDEMKWSKMVQNKGEIINWNMQEKIYKSQMLNWDKSCFQEVRKSNFPP